jgi:putative FmdB family regulatory protein
MPIYEYRCRECNTTFEMLVRRGTTVACPDCGSLSVGKQISAPFVSSRETTRQAGHTCCGREERCVAPPCSQGSTCRRDP